MLIPVRFRLPYFTGGKDSWQKRIVARWQGNGAASEVSDGIHCFDRFGYGNAG